MKRIIRTAGIFAPALLLGACSQGSAPVPPPPATVVTNPSTPPVVTPPPIIQPDTPSDGTVFIGDYWPQPPVGQVWSKYLWLQDDPDMGNIAKAQELWQFTATTPGWILTSYLPDGAGGWRVTSHWYLKFGPNNASWLEWQDWEPPNSTFTYATGKEFVWGIAGTSIGTVQHSEVYMSNGTYVGPFDVTFQALLPTFTTPIGTFNNVLQIATTQTQGTLVTPANYWLAPGHGPVRVDYPGTTPLSRFALDMWT